MTATIFIALYWITAVVHLAAEVLMLIGFEELLVVRHITKPALMILLFMYYLAKVGSNRGMAQKFILFSLAFSWSGDVNLMMPSVEGFAQFEEQFFLLGLVSFLIAHVLYIFSFRMDVVHNGGHGALSKKPWLVVPFVLFLIGFMYVLFPKIDVEMQIPVIVYATVINLMGLAAIHRWGKVSKESFWWVMGGALLFIASDSMIAINKFLEPFESSRSLIMLTYITAQYMIVKGTINPTGSASKN